MDADVKNCATAVFNSLNRYLNLLNRRPEGDGKKGALRGSQFLDRNLAPFDLSYPSAFLENLGSIAKTLDVRLNFNTLQADILCEEDSPASEQRNSQLSRVDTEDSGLISEATDSPADTPPADDELISNLSSDRANDSDERSYIGSADSNFVNYTYWSVETGENVSTTTSPAYVNARNCRVSLLQESEAFVARAIWGPEQSQLKFTPRHLLLQVTQIANRAFFDPDYRKYLELNYV